MAQVSRLPTAAYALCTGDYRGAITDGHRLNTRDVMGLVKVSAFGETVTPRMFSHKSSIHGGLSSYEFLERSDVYWSLNLFDLYRSANVGEIIVANAKECGYSLHLDCDEFGELVK
jgi:hypothetical protein